MLANFSLTIRHRHSKPELPQEAWVDAGGIARPHMGKIERGERNVTLLDMQKIAKALRCKLS